MLCSVCTDVFHGRSSSTPEAYLGKDSSRYNHHFTVQSLEESASNGCYICRRISSAYEKEAIRNRQFTNVTIANAAPISYLRLLPWTHPASYMLQSSYTNTAGETRSVSFFFLQTISSLNGLQQELLSDWEMRPLLIRRTKRSDTSSKESLDQARAWIHQCASSHPKCNERTGSKWIPTRLLDVDGELPTSPIRLVCTADEPVHGRYITLSHCWGRTPFIQLLKSNLEQFKHSIVFSSLPKTFQDIVKVARAFGVRYVWIDSLCIIQDKDDLSDWHHEAALMGKVYSNAHCNIAASAASDSSMGLFMTRDSSVLQPHVIQLRDVHQSGNSDNSPYILVPVEYWSEFVSSGPLSKRGWVFQERLLAPRVLYFAHLELAWECHEFEATETYPYGLPHVCMPTYSSALSKRTVFGVRPSPTDQNISEVQTSLWRDIVWLYSDTSVTVPTDKLVALSGVAKKVKNMLDDDYIAGMWLKELPHQLLWYPMCAPDRLRKGNLLSIDDTFTPDDTPPYVAPTWSWASVSHVQIEMFHRSHHSFLTIEEVRVKYATEDTTGTVLDGHIDLKSFLLPCSIPFDPINGSACEFEYGFHNTSINSAPPKSNCPGSDDNGSTNDVQPIEPSPDAWEKRPRRWHVSMDRPTRLHDSLDVWCLLATSISSNWYFLMLRVVDARKGIFERIGTAETRWLSISDRDEPKDPELAAAAEFRVDADVARTFPCLKYIEEEGKHVVRVI